MWLALGSEAVSSIIIVAAVDILFGFGKINSIKVIQQPTNRQSWINKPKVAFGGILKAWEGAILFLMLSDIGEDFLLVDLVEGS